MASILWKPVPSRNDGHGRPYSYAAAPSSLDDERTIESSTPSFQRDSLHRASTPDSNNKPEVASKVAEYEKLEQEKTSPWGIHWYSPALMLGLFFTGIATSIAHHIFYDSLDGKDVGTTMAQEWAIRIGTGMAFIIKASLAAAVGVAYTQRLWVTLKKKAITLQAVDDLFLLTMTPTSFFSWEVLSKAKLLCFMAASMWFIPLVATITPATLSISPIFAHTVRDIVVPFLDFSGEKSKLYYVVTPETTQYLPTGAPSAGTIGPSVFVKQLLSAVSMGGRVLHAPPQSSNFSFELEFFGPSFKCYNLTTPAGNNETDPKAPSDNPAEQKEVELLRPMHRLVRSHYQVATDWNGEKAGWMYWGFSGVLQRIFQGMAERYPDYTGYEELEEPTRMLDTLHVYLRPESNYTNRSLEFDGISCMLWNTSYAVLFSSQGTEQSTSITRLKRTEEIHVNGSMAVGNFTASQRAYKGYSEAFVELLTGSISSAESVFRDYSKSGEISSIADSTCNKGPKELLSTTLAYCTEFNPLFNGTGRMENPTTCRNGTLLQAIEDLSLNVTLSLFSSPDLAANTTVRANFFTAVNRYSYNWQNLALAYGVGILVALIGIAIGAHSYFTNGYSASMSFSSIVFTTRNPDLDKISEGRCLPALPVGPELGKIKLRYGLLHSEERVGHEHAAFGCAGSIGELKKGTKCV